MAAVVNTVTGPISPDDLGITLMHEHILYGYPGWEGDQTIAPFDGEAIVANAVMVLDMLKSLGLRTYVDATALDGGRNPGDLPGGFGKDRRSDYLRHGILLRGRRRIGLLEVSKRSGRCRRRALRALHERDHRGNPAIRGFGPA